MIDKGGKSFITAGLASSNIHSDLRGGRKNFSKKESPMNLLLYFPNSGYHLLKAHNLGHFLLLSLLVALS